MSSYFEKATALWHKFYTFSLLYALIFSCNIFIICMGTFCQSFTVIKSNNNLDAYELLGKNFFPLRAKRVSYVLK